MSMTEELDSTPKTTGSTLNHYLFDTCGYVKQSAFLSPEEAKEFEQLLRDAWPESASGGIFRIRSLTAISPRFKQLALSLATKLKLGGYINQPFRLIESYALRRTAGSVQALHNGFGQPMTSVWGAPARAMWRHHTYHDGKIYCMMVKVLVYLTDIVSEDDAPFCLVEGSHKANLPIPFTEAEIEEGAPLALPNMRLVFPRSGDVLIINEALMHGTYPKKSQEPRIVMAFSYSPSFVTDYREGPCPDASDIWTNIFYA